MFKKGSINPRWRDGTSEYPDHCIMKKNRLLKLKSTKGKCEICGKKAFIVHHIDKSKTNHNINNLIALCRSCHDTVHPDRYFKQRKTSKIIRMYGMSVQEMRKKMGGSVYFYYRLHRLGQLKDFIAKYGSKAS